MAIEFGIRAWAACAPALQSPEAWQAWSLAPWLPEGSDLPALAAMAPMLRRRVNAIGPRGATSRLRHPPARRGTRQPAAPPRPPCLPRATATPAAPSTCSANWPPASRCRPPRSASLSTTPLARCSRSTGVTPPTSSAVAAGRDTVETAAFEACALLADGADEVLLVCYDAPLPEAYAEFADEPGCLFGWAWRIGKPRLGRAGVPARHRPCARGVGPRHRPSALLPHALDVLRFMLIGDAELRHRGERAVWRGGSAMVERLDRAWRVSPPASASRASAWAACCCACWCSRRWRCCRGPPRPASACAAMSSIMPSGCSSG